MKKDIDRERQMNAEIAQTKTPMNPRLVRAIMVRKYFPYPR